jgi:hypothetical protein
MRFPQGRGKVKKPIIVEKKSFDSALSQMLSQKPMVRRKIKADPKKKPVIPPQK